MTSPGQPKSPAQLYQDGGVAFRKEDWAAARAALEQSLAMDPDRPAAVYNLGLVEFRSGKKGLGIALWRKALAMSPGFAPAEAALAWANNQIPRSMNLDPGVWENFRDAVLVRISLIEILSIALMVFAFSVYLFLRYVGARRRAVLDERPTPPFPTVAWFFALLLICAIALSAAKTYDLMIDRATVLTARVPARTTPDAEATTLFDLFEGAEVIVRQSQGDWWQISVPGGLTGWVQKDALFFSSSRRTEQ
ncbi:MAG: tetratricopeptide repeat protein [Bdellovibrionaceae bacterium]|nr:tetratricopeptide repeat protein [Pseudobdellovibrionaceae bacterium]